MTCEYLPLPVNCHLPVVTCQLSHASCHLSTRLSPVNSTVTCQLDCHLSAVTCQLSPAFTHRFFSLVLIKCIAVGCILTVSYAYCYRMEHMYYGRGGPRPPGDGPPMVNEMEAPMSSAIDSRLKYSCDSPAELRCVYSFFHLPHPSFYILQTCFCETLFLLKLLFPLQ